MTELRGRAILGIAGDVDLLSRARAFHAASPRLAHRGSRTSFRGISVNVSGIVFGAENPLAIPTSLRAGASSSPNDSVLISLTEPLELRADSVGRRSLFVCARPRFLVFATELSAVRAALMALDVDVTIDPAAWRRFLAFSFIPAPRTPYRDVLQVPAGHRATWSLEQGLSECTRFFDTPIASGPSPTDEIAITELRAAIDASSESLAARSTRRALLLSGGLDSAAIAVSLAKVAPRSSTLTIDLEDDSEAEFASEIASTLGLAHHRIAVTANDVISALPAIIRYLDVPIGDPVVAPFFLAARKSDVDELWNGEGGDQLFAGWATKPMLSWARYAAPDDDPAAAYLRTFHKLADVEDEALGDVLRVDRSPLEDDLRPFLTGARASRHDGFLNLLCDANLWLKGAGNILPRIDRMCAAHGIEAVSPLLDERVLTIAFALDPSQKQRGITEKWALRESLRTALPPHILDRPKRGMRVPLTRWFAGELGDFARDILTSRVCRERGFLQTTFVDALLAGEIRSPDLRRRRRDEWLWLALISELWLLEHA